MSKPVCARFWAFAALVCTSVKNYRKGMLEGKPALVAASKVPMLGKTLAGMLKRAASERAALQARRDAALRQQLSAEIDLAMARRQLALQERQCWLDQRLAQAKADLTGFAASLGQRISRYESA